MGVCARGAILQGFFRNTLGAIFRHANFGQRFGDADLIQQGANIAMEIIKLIGVETGGLRQGFYFWRNRWRVMLKRGRQEDRVGQPVLRVIFCPHHMRYRMH